MKTIYDLSTEDILEYVQDHLKIKTKEKDEFGEVFTPPHLINEILDRIPLKVWKDPNTRWLDPAAGIGNFPALVYCRLLDTLKSAIPNKQKRKRHIIENMLFMVEINPTNVQEIRKFFGPKIRVFQGDFLENSRKWGDSFDVILGNPPFQTSKKKDYEGSVGNRTLWDKFIHVALEPGMLNDGGYLAFVTPAGWRRPEASLYDLMTKNNTLIYLHIYGKSDGLDMFGVQTRFDVFIIEKGDSQTIPLIIDEKGGRIKDVDPRKWPFLPNFAFDKIRKILVPLSEYGEEGKPGSKGIPVIFDSSVYDARKLSKNKTRRFRYPVVHNITRRGLGIRYAKDRNPEQMGVPKVLLNFNERQYPYNDYLGQYGMSQLTFGVPIKSKKEGEKWIQRIESPDFQEVLRATKWGAFQTDYRMFRHFLTDP